MLLVVFFACFQRNLESLTVSLKKSHVFSLVYLHSKKTSQNVTFFYSNSIKYTLYHDTVAVSNNLSDTAILKSLA